MKSAMKMMIAAMMAGVAPIGITADSGGGAVDAGAPAAPAGGGQLLVDSINAYFESADKRHLKDAMLMIADKVDQAAGSPRADQIEQLKETIAMLSTRMANLEDFTGILPAGPVSAAPVVTQA